MRCSPARILACLALGLATTVGVAWVRSWQVNYEREHWLTNSIITTGRHPVEGGGGYWTVIVSERAGATHVYAVRSQVERVLADTAGQAVVQLSMEQLMGGGMAARRVPAWSCVRDELEYEERWSTGERVTEDARGFPFRALYYRMEYQKFQPPVASHALRVRDFAPRAPAELYLPVGIIWLGLLGDIGVWASAWLGLGLSVAALRGLLRRGERRCPACGYALRGVMSGCPECGWRRAEKLT